MSPSAQIVLKLPQLSFTGGLSQVDTIQTIISLNYLRSRNGPFFMGVVVARIGANTPSSPYVAHLRVLLEAHSYLSKSL